MLSGDMSSSSEGLSLACAGARISISGPHISYEWRRNSFQDGMWTRLWSIESSSQFYAAATSSRMARASQISDNSRVAFPALINMSTFRGLPNSRSPSRDRRSSTMEVYSPSSLVGRVLSRFSSLGVVYGPRLIVDFSRSKIRTTHRITPSALSMR